MLRTDLTDHRGTDDARLLSAVADGDAIALAEAYHRTVAAAHACARRLLASPVEIEALLRAVYSDLWDDPPLDGALEGWVRARCFDLGTGYLRQRGLQAPSASLADLTPGIDADPHRRGDAIEQMIAELTDKQRAALVAAHDRGIRTAEQEDAEAGWSLLHALLVLASPLTDNERHAAEMCSSGVALANWIFGLLPPYEASAVPGTAAEPTPCGRLAGVLRRARRRFEPLPPTPDLGHRVLASVLSGSSGRRGDDTGGSSLDPGLRVPYAEIGRSSDTPRSSLDMTVRAPLPSHTGEHDTPAQRSDNGGRDPWSTDGGDMLSPRPGAPRALAPSNPPPEPRPSMALAPPVDPTDPPSEDLVRMPLRRPPGQSPHTSGDAPINGGPAPAPSPLPSSDVRSGPWAGADDDATAPPTGLRDDAADGGAAQSPLRPDEQRQQSPGDDATDSPLRRPSIQARRGGEGQAEQREARPPRGLDATARAPFQRDDSAPSPLQRDDSAPSPLQRDDGPRSPFQDDDTPVPPATSAATTTTAAMPALRRRDAERAPGRLTATPPSQGAVAIDDDESSGGAGILRWVVVLLLIAMGAAFGIWLGTIIIS